ncbi:CRISPR-associated endoribonuclease Cas6 [Clostridium sp. BJN0013]|uniref:CRISPR-associated endoribonuclease Cas6 n=1 Tax=Clostridium sp. BJN0013 TaxID=3236840 RepID=UPI0034C626BA
MHKHEVHYGTKPWDSCFSITPLNKEKLKQKIVMYKGYVIKGWDGEFLMRGLKELMDIDYNAGIGSKNS